MICQVSSLYVISYVIVCISYHSVNIPFFILPAISYADCCMMFSVIVVRCAVAVYFSSEIIMGIELLWSLLKCVT